MSVAEPNLDTSDDLVDDYIIGSSRKGSQDNRFDLTQIGFVVPSEQNSTAIFESAYIRDKSENIDSMPLDLKVREPLAPSYVAPSREHFNVYQKWEGYVLEVTDDSFLARLVPLVGEGGDQEAEIYLEEVSMEDRELVEPGAIFYWSIGYLNKPSGQHIRASIIRFQRLPPMTDLKSRQSEAKLAQLKLLLGMEQ